MKAVLYVVCVWAAQMAEGQETPAVIINMKAVLYVVCGSTAQTVEGQES